MTKHSPAPWTETETDDGDVIVRMDEGHAILIGNLEDTCGVCHANARLISVAPELLDTNEKTLKSLIAFRDEVLAQDMIVPMWVNDAIDDIQLIVAKAQMRRKKETKNKSH